MIETLFSVKLPNSSTPLNDSTNACAFVVFCVIDNCLSLSIFDPNILINEITRTITEFPEKFNPFTPRSISYRNQSIDLQSKSMDWFLYDIGLGRERVNPHRNVLEYVDIDEAYSILNCNNFRAL